MTYKVKDLRSGTLVLCSDPWLVISISNMIDAELIEAGISPKYEICAYLCSQRKIIKYFIEPNLSFCHDVELIHDAHR